MTSSAIAEIETWFRRQGVPSLADRSARPGAALRRALTVHLADMQAQVVPVLLVTVLFLYFSAETWQLTDTLTWTRLALALLLFWPVAMLPTARVVRSQMHLMNSRPVLDRVRDTPAAALAGDAVATELSRRQKINLFLMIVSRQIGPVVAVGITTFGFFVTLGAVLVRRNTAATWIGGDPAPFIGSLRPKNGIASAIVASDLWQHVAASPAAMVRTSALLAGFAGMSFAVALMSERQYRVTFFAGALADLEQILAVRAVYATVTRRPPRPARRVSGVGWPAEPQSSSSLVTRS